MSLPHLATINFICNRNQQSLCTGTGKSIRGNIHNLGLRVRRDSERKSTRFISLYTIVIQEKKEEI